MKNIIYLVFLVFSTNVFAQSAIVNDELFLKYEKEYLNYLNSRNHEELKELDQAEGSFYKMFKDAKALKSFKKNKDQAKWLQKNISKTNFNSVNEADTLYKRIVFLQDKHNEEGKISSQLLNELIKKYDATLVWETLKSRLPK